MDEAERVKMMAELEQATATLRQALPPALWGFYNALLEEGFKPSGALMLTCHYMDKLMCGK